MLAQAAEEGNEEAKEVVARYLTNKIGPLNRTRLSHLTAEDIQKLPKNLQLAIKDLLVLQDLG